MKKCPRCKIEKDDGEFYVQKSGRYIGKLASWCKDCCSKQSAERYKNFPEKCKEEHREWVNRNKEKVAITKMTSTYGITKDQYDAMPKVCQICGREDNLVIDHCHSSKRVRGLLCDRCNKGLGFFRDNPAHLSRASDYVLGIHQEIIPSHCLPKVNEI